ncbi:MAG: DUF4339 domain-containing protein [Chlamydiia bacterium]|nr:DUF4339 domain-containing protein [Chlamydiia bacterium]
MYLFFCLLIWTLLGYYAARIAEKRGRNPNVWFLLGATLGLLGILLLFIFPEKKRVMAPAANLPAQNLKPLSAYTPQEEVAKAPPEPLWYYLDQTDAQHGPMSFNALKEAWSEQKISPSTYLWNETMNGWEKLSSLPNALENIQK